MTKQRGIEIDEPWNIIYEDENSHYVLDGTLHKTSENDAHMTHDSLDASGNSYIWFKIQKLAETPKLIEQRKYLLETEKNYVEGNDLALDNLLSVLQVKDTYVVHCTKLKGTSKYYLVIAAKEVIGEKERGWSYIFWIFSIFGLATLLHVVFSWALWLVSILALCLMSIKLWFDRWFRLHVFVSYKYISKKQLILIKNYYQKLNKNKKTETKMCDLFDKTYANYFVRPKNEQEFNKWFEKQEKFRKANEIRDQIINEN